MVDVLGEGMCHVVKPLCTQNFGLSPRLGASKFVCCPPTLDDIMHCPSNWTPRPQSDGRVQHRRVKHCEAVNCSEPHHKPWRT